MIQNDVKSSSTLTCLAFFNTYLCVIIFVFIILKEQINLVQKFSTGFIIFYFLKTLKKRFIQSHTSKNFIIVFLRGYSSFFRYFKGLLAVSFALNFFLHY